MFIVVLSPRRGGRLLAEPVEASVDRDVIGAGVVAGCELLALQEDIVEQARGAEAEQVRLQPLLPRGLGDRDDVLDGIFGGADAAGRFHTDLLARAAIPVAHGL